MCVSWWLSAGVGWRVEGVAWRRTFCFKTKNYLVKQRWLSLWVGTDFALLDEKTTWGAEWTLGSIGHFLSSSKALVAINGSFFHVHFIGEQEDFPLNSGRRLTARARFGCFYEGWSLLCLRTYFREGTEGDCTSCCESGPSPEGRCLKYSNICVAV